MTFSCSLIQKMSYAVRLSEQQRQPDWLSRFELRNMNQPLVLKNPSLKWLHEQGIHDVDTGLQWLRQWVTADQPELPIFIIGSRDLCWHISWLIEVIEGRVEDDVPAKIPSGDYYLLCRYGTELYDRMWSTND